MIKFAIAFVLGCLSCFGLGEPPPWPCLLAAVVLAAAFAFRHKIVPACFLLGLVWTALHAQQLLDHRLAHELEGRDLLLSGHIASVPVAGSDRASFLFTPDTWPVGHVRLNWYSPPAQLPQAGQRWQLMLRLKAPHGLKNPGSFDYEGWLFRERIAATGYVAPSTSNRRLAVAPWYSVNHWRGRLRSSLEQRLEDSPVLPLVLGLGLGMRDQLDNAHWDTLRVTGTSHLLAISGLHIGLAATLGFFLLRGLWSLSTRTLNLLPAQQVGAVGAVLAALFYALLAGLSIPTQRALIMVGIALIGVVLNRPHFIGHLLGASLILVLLWDPLSVLSAGFWLSFGAVSLILLRCAHRHPAPRGQWLHIHLWIAVGLTPLLVLFFNQTSLIAPLANLVAVPLVSLLIVPLLLLAMSLIAVWEPAAMLLIKFAAGLLQLLWEWLSLLGRLPLADWTVPEMPLPLLLMMCAGILPVLLPRGVPARWLGLFVALPLLFWQPQRPAAGQFWFTLLDVGQGLSAVVETRDHVLVFDAGAAFGDRFDMGSAVVAPYLRSRGWRHIDTVVVSHADNDHAGGLRGLRTAFGIDRLLGSEVTRIDGATPCLAGQAWRWNDVAFEILQPHPGQPGTNNNRSCVLKITSDDYSVLLTGDIEREAEFALLRHYGQTLSADVLVVPHHGSRTSSTQAFIDAVSPDYALFPVGYRNRYGFPLQEVTERYAARGIRLMRTDLAGAIVLRPDRDGTPQLTAWRQQARRLWTSHY